jgi:hypothetical protein
LEWRVVPDELVSLVVPAVLDALPERLWAVVVV